jgi:PP-loop superfamily ATP-utilizing enzyme
MFSFFEKVPFFKEFLPHAGKLRPDKPNRTKIIKKLKSLGFKYVTVDLQDFRSWLLNEVLTKE